MLTSKDWFAKIERWRNWSDEAGYSKSEYGSLRRHKHQSTVIVQLLSVPGGQTFHNNMFTHFTTVNLLTWWLDYRRVYSALAFANIL